MSLGLIPDLIGGLFGSKEKGGDVIDTTPKWLQELQKTLGAQVNQGLLDYTPGASYTGDLNVAGTPTSQEQSGLDQLTKYLGKPGTGSLFDQATGQISDTLSGKFADPNASPFIKAMMKVGQNQLNDQITQERGTRGARGTYYTNAGINAEGKLRGTATDNLNALVGQFIQQERQNQLGAATTAQQLDQYKNQTVPLNAINASQTYGGLARTIQQANLESQYQDFVRQRTELGNNQNVATTLAVNQPNITPGQVTTPKYNAPNDLGNILGIVDNSVNSTAKTAAGLAGAFTGISSGVGSLQSMLSNFFKGGGGNTGAINPNAFANLGLS